ncbi:hypothetical protein ASD38_16680 [Caulobacter sp. Root487D2Y]|nr:hypothetical protein ASD38_16680 [Caulobacter sp. Root487D2Y]
MSADAYRQRHLERFQATSAGKRAVYLDLNYWIDLQGAAAGMPRRPEFAELLEVLRAGVSGGQLMCPVSYSVLAELSKQTDPATRGATGHLVDDLCCGAGLMADDELIAFEVAGLFLSTLGSDKTVLDRERVWKPVGCIASNSTLSSVPFNPTRQHRQRLEKVFFDTLLIMTAEEAVMMDLPRWASPWADLAQKLNDGNAAHVHEIDKFEDLLAAEAQGAARGSAPMIAAAVEILRKELGRPGDFSAASPDWPRLVGAALSKNETTQSALPSLYIRSGLHALLRWNRTQKFKPNDIFDFSHAAGALGYCDLFLTEGPLKDMLGRGPLRLAEATDCKVVASPTDALGAVQALIAVTGSAN